MLLLSILLKVVNDLCPAYSPFFGTMGVACALIFSVVGAAYGTAKSAIGISSSAVIKPELMIKSTIPVIFAGVIPIYGLIVDVVIITGLDPSRNYTLMKSFMDMGAGLTVGLTGLAAGMAIGIAGDVGVRGNAQQQRLYVGMVLILIFGEALALYGLIVSILLTMKKDDDCVITDT